MRIGVFIKALLAVRARPGIGLFKLFLIVDIELIAALHLGHIHPLCADAEIFLQKLRITVRSGDTHSDRADADISLIAHLADRRGTAGEAQDFFRYVGGNGVIIRILHIVTID